MSGHNVAVEELLVTEKALIFWRASDEKVEAYLKVQKKMQKGDADAMSEVGSDIAFYESNVADLGKRANLKIYHSKANRIIFKKVDGTTAELKNSATALDNNLFIFNGIDQPKKVDEIVPFEQELKKYFGIK